MVDVSIIGGVMIFILWIFFIDLSITSKEFAFSVIQLILGFNLAIFLFVNSYLSGFIMGYFIVLTIIIATIYLSVYNFNDIKKTKNN